jgi:hypothetical protein
MRNKPMPEYKEEAERRAKPMPEYKEEAERRPIFEDELTFEDNRTKL